MARSPGHSGQPPQAPPHAEAVPQWRHPADHGPLSGHASAHPPFAAASHAAPAFAPAHDPSQFGQHAGHSHVEPSLSGYMPHTQPPLTQQPNMQGGYDLGQFGHAPQPAPTHDQYGRPLAPQPDQWAQTPYGQQGAHQQQYLDPHALQHAAYADPQRAPQGYPSLAAPLAGAVGSLAASQAFAQQPQHPQAAPVADQAYDDEYDEDPLEDEPKRGRKLMVVGALVGAICVGGGLAYAYKAFSGGKSPMIAAKQSPKATPPQQPPKVAAKLPDVAPAQAVAAAGSAEEGPRRVQTIAVAPPGAAAVAPPQPTPPPSSAVMPGMVLDNLRVPGQAPPAPQAVPPPAAQPTAPLRPAVPPPVAQPAPVQPPAKVAALPPAAPVQPKVTNAPAAAAAVPAAAPEAPKKVAPVPKAKAADAYNPNAAPGASGGVTPAPAPPAGKSALGANGFVATVLSTQKGRPEAMKAFADLQQKYPDVLGGKPAEVQEKDLGAEKGVWFRAVVGPPGSRAAASDVCTQLKASGYGQCFVTAY